MTEERYADAAEVTEAPIEPLSGQPPASVPAREGATVARRRPRSLRIPDDEVARPKSADGPPDTEGHGAVESVVTPTRIISINPEPAPAPPAEAPLPAAATVPTLQVDEGDRETLPQIDPKLAAPVSSEEVEVRFEDEPSEPGPARVDVRTSTDGERKSDPGDAPEIAAEDLVAVEAPAAASALPPARPRVSSQPPVPPPVKPAPPVPRAPLVIVPPHVGSMPAAQSAEAAARRKPRLWWEELFNDDYLHAMERVTDEQIAREVHFIEESLGVERGGALLDLACGTGRHAVELAKRGYEVVGFDLSLAMLARAGEDAQEQEAKLNFVQGDMRDMTFEEQFDGVYCWNTSFGYFEEDKNALVVDRVHRALKGGGLFLLDVVNRDFLVRQSPSLAWFEGDGCVCMDEMCVDFITSRMKVKRTMMLDDGRSREIEYSMRIYSLHELGRILHEHGFTVREVSGRLQTPGVFFGGDSPRTMILAEKR
jgi:SAM-dependent methyltransferase